MKKIQCPNCSRVREVEDDVVGTLCPCGEYLKFAKSGVLTNDLSKDDQMLLKDAFNRGRAKGKEETIEQMLELIDTKIKVNLR